jgi:hypothetical protein
VFSKVAAVSDAGEVWQETNEPGGCALKDYSVQRTACAALEQLITK